MIKNKWLIMSLVAGVGFLVFIYGLQAAWAGLVALFVGTELERKARRIKDLSIENQEFRATIEIKEGGIIEESKSEAEAKRQELNSWLDK